MDYHRPGAGLPGAPVTIELDDIQATVLRHRPEPYYGTHVMLHVDEAQAGREFVRRLTPHVESASGWWKAGRSWTSVAISYAGLVALGVPEDSLQSFPEAFRAGMAARAGQLLDYGPNDPEHWDAPFGSGLIHIGVSVFSDSEQTWRQTMGMARRQYEGFPGVTVLIEQDFGAQPGDLNPLGFKDSIGEPAIEGSGVDPLPSQGPAVKAGEFILGYPGETGVPLPMPRPDALGRNGTFAGLRKYQSRVGTFNRFLREHAGTEQERELLAAKLMGRWRSGTPLNPRDTKLEILTDVNVHRIIRRSTTYGAPYEPDAISAQDDETARGLYFIFLSAKAMATLEFLQQEWINNGNFMNLGSERDPNVGLQEDGATFTIPREPVRRSIHEMETFNVLRGGEYFFMPSLSALRWLADL